MSGCDIADDDGEIDLLAHAMPIRVEGGAPELNAQLRGRVTWRTLWSHLIRELRLRVLPFGVAMVTLGGMQYPMNRVKAFYFVVLGWMLPGWCWPICTITAGAITWLKVIWPLPMTLLYSIAESPLAPTVFQPSPTTVVQSRADWITLVLHALTFVVQALAMYQADMRLTVTDVRWPTLVVLLWFSLLTRLLRPKEPRISRHWPTRVLYFARLVSLRSATILLLLCTLLLSCLTIDLLGFGS